MEDTKARYAAGVEHLMDDLRAVLRDGQQLLEAGMGGLKEKAGTSMKSADRVVRDYPYQSIGIAFGVGIFLGILASRQPRRRRLASRNGHSAE